MTITTVGYGDVSSKGNDQRILGMAGMVMGALLFGYGVTVIIGMFEESRHAQVEFRKTADKFNRYMASRNISTELRHQVQTFLGGKKMNQLECMSSNEEFQLLMCLSEGLREQIAKESARSILDAMPFFEGVKSAKMMFTLFFALKTQYVAKAECIFETGEQGTNMYFIQSGTVAIYEDGDDYDSDSYSAYFLRSGFLGHKPLTKLGRGDFFGELALLEKGHERPHSVHTRTFCDFRTLSVQALHQAFAHSSDGLKQTIKDMVHASIDKHPNHTYRKTMDRVYKRMLMRQKKQESVVKGRGGKEKKESLSTDSETTTRNETKEPPSPVSGITTPASRMREIGQQDGELRQRGQIGENRSKYETGQIGRTRHVRAKSWEGQPRRWSNESRELGQRRCMVKTGSFGELGQIGQMCHDRSMSMERQFGELGQRRLMEENGQFGKFGQIELIRSPKKNLTTANGNNDPIVEELVTIVTDLRGSQGQVLAALASVQAGMQNISSRFETLKEEPKFVDSYHCQINRTNQRKKYHTSYVQPRLTKVLDSRDISSHCP